jgi:uncharacterized protein (DUF4213/DUF364 family)
VVFNVTLSLLEELSSYVESKPPVSVNMVFIGQGFTAVRLATGDVGLASSPLTRFDTCIGATRLAGSLTRCDSRELAKFLNPRQPAHLRSIGLAAVNAVLQSELQKRTDFLEGDFLKFLSIEPGENVAMVDYYTTKIEFLKGSKLTVFDNRFAGKREDISILPLSAMQEQFPKADVVILPPTFMDKVEDLRQYASRARHFVVVHPTTPPLPEPFFKRGVTMVASMMILDAESLLRHVLEGAGTTLFKKFCKKIVFLKD